MARFIKKMSDKVGLPPGTLIHVGEKKVDRVRIRIIDYDESEIEEREADSVEECFPYREKPTVTWINIDGLHDLEVVETLGKQFRIHPLILEDIVHTGQRPKVEDFDDYMYVVMKMLYYREEAGEVYSEQFSLVLGPDYVITFQEQVGDVFDPLRERLRKRKGRIRKGGADYLAYALIDAVVDNYFGILERFGEHIESIEEEVMSTPTPETLKFIQGMKRELIFLRKMIWPLREVVSTMERGDSALIRDSNQIYYRDVYDHTIQVIDSIEAFRDMVSGMLDIYLSSVSNRMNEVMKVLTIIATIFIPLSFFAGIYGMNFEFIPELKWRFGYLYFWTLIIAVVSVMFVYFRRKKWF